MTFDVLSGAVHTEVDVLLLLTMACATHMPQQSDNEYLPCLADAKLSMAPEQCSAVTTGCSATITDKSLDKVNECCVTF